MKQLNITPGLLTKLLALVVCMFLASCNSSTDPAEPTSDDVGPSASAAWDTHFTYSGDSTNTTKGLSAPVSKLLIYDGDLYGFGYFHFANSTKYTYSCAFVWNGTTFDSLAAGPPPLDTYYGIDHIRYALHYGGKILVSGVYEVNSENRLSTFNGASWTNPTIAGSFSTKAVSNGSDLYDYYIHTGVGFPNDSSEIYKYDGTKFNLIGGFSAHGLTYESITSLGVDANSLYVATKETGVIVFDPKAWVYRYNGSTFTELKPSADALEGMITRLIWVDGTLYALGDIRLSGGESGVAKWDGVDWKILPAVSFEASPTNPVVDAVIDKNNNIYVATESSVFRFNGVSATKLGTVTGGSIASIAIKGDKLFLGGSFSAVDGVPSNYFAVLH